MKYSLISMKSKAWIQNHIGTLETATAAAIATEKANSNKIDVGVMEQTAEIMPYLVPNVRRLDCQRVFPQ
jgi:hypothetical protein